MHVPLSEAKDRLGELVAHAESGAEVILTQDGRAAVRLVPVPQRVAPEETPEERARRRHAVIEAVLESVRSKPRSSGPSAARSQDFLYDDDGLPS